MPKRFGSPNMSDTTLLVSVEDLINMAMGPADVNVVNFKMIQTVLHILARQLRMLETQVEIRVQEAPPRKEKKEKKPPKQRVSSSPDSSSPRVSTQKPAMKEIKEEKTRPSREREKETKSAAREQEKAEKATLKEKERAIREKEKEEKMSAKDREKAEKERAKEEKMSAKEREKAEKERAKEEKSTSKEREKAEKEKAKEEKMTAKEQEKAQKEKAKEDKSSAKEKEKAEKEKAKEAEADLKAEKAALKEKEKAERAESKERDKAGRAESKEREKAEKAESKEREKAAKAESKERERAERDESKQKEKAGRADSKEREKAERAESKEREKAERAESKEREKAERAESKEREKAERAESKEREQAEKAEAKEKEKAERASAKERERAEQAALKDKEKAEREQSRDREKSIKIALKEREAAERAESKERDKQLQTAIKLKEKTEREESRMREKQSRAESKEREKAEKAEEKEREKAERAESKERERAERDESKQKEKAGRAESKEREKAERDESKERDKSAKAESKERDKSAKAESKERDKSAKAESKERDKAAKADSKEKDKLEKEEATPRAKSAKTEAKEAEKEEEKITKADVKEPAGKGKGKSEKMDQKKQEDNEAEKEAAKQKEKLDKMSPKEKAKEEKGRGKTGKPGISIKEKDKVLIVEKGPTTRTDSRTRVGSKEVVTLSQFEMLEAIVLDLKQKAGPLPFPAMPDNQKLRRELSRGSASLTDTMQAMQVAARVQATELAIGRMAGLLTQLAAAGALPDDVAGKLDDVKAEMDAVAEESAKARHVAEGPPRKSVAIDPVTKKTSAMSKVEGVRPSTAGARPSVSSRPSATSRASLGGGGVSHNELDNAVRSLRDDLTKNVNLMTAKATAAAESAAATAKAVSDKLDIALKLNTRISTLYSLVTDYAEQLSGFDAGLTTQMQSFQEQMAQMRSDLKGGVTLLESANNNAETAAVTELTERYEGLVAELDATLQAHTALTAFQKQLADELHSLLECVEMLREQKADRDEVQDGLRDKADNSRLAGLLTEADFAASRGELERRLDLCYDKFRKQEQVWMGAIRDLTNTAEGKAEIMQLLAARDDAQQQLRDIQQRLQQLAAILGEPKAAMVTRQLSVGARCGACLVPALQEPEDASAGKPPLLPASRPLPQEQPCLPDWRPPPPPEAREHTCHRWVGGSHTLLGESTVREQAGALQTLGPPSRRYTGYGSDGRLYMMEEELRPCVECNVISTDLEKLPEEKQPEPAAQADGAGDTGPAQTEQPKTEPILE